MALITRVVAKSGIDPASNEQNVPMPGTAGEVFDICQPLEQQADGKFYKFTGTRALAGVSGSPATAANVHVSVMRAGARFWVGATLVPGTPYFAAAAGEFDSAATAGDAKGAFVARVELDPMNNPVTYYLEIVRLGKLT